MKRPAITAAMRLQVLKLFGAVVLCQVCTQCVYIADVEIDHEQALVDGGPHDFRANMRPLCQACHARKSAREHKANSRAKRLAKDRETHQAILSGAPKAKGSIKSRGFQGHKKFNGEHVWRTK